ncbi:MAG: hypothetical protein HPZ91_16165 [Lentisphaeria bacterium]|nr:hypothetical protein [Lentisphaeria bacterium]
MTISPFELYMILKLDDISNLLSVLGIPLIVFSILSAIAFIIWSIASIAEGDEENIQALGRLIKKIFFMTFGALLVIGLLQAAIPTTRQMAAILVVPAIVNSEFMQKDLPADLREIYTLAKEGMFKALTDEKGEGEEK